MAKCHINVSKLTIIGSDNGFALSRWQAIIWTNAGMFLTRFLGTHFSEILNEIYTFSFKKVHLILSSGKWWPYCVSLNVLTKMPYSMTRPVIWCTTHKSMTSLTWHRFLTLLQINQRIFWSHHNDQYHQQWCTQVLSSATNIVWYDTYFIPFLWVYEGHFDQYIFTDMTFMFDDIIRHPC